MNYHQTALIIEDNAGDVRLIRDMLAEFQFKLECESRLSDGLSRIKRGDIQVVLLDLGLPDSQGVNTSRKLSAETPLVPIVVLTGLDDEQLAMEAVQAGAQDYLVKGQVSGNDLVRALRYAIERKRLERALRDEAESARESEKRFLDLANSITDSFFALDHHLKFTFWNKAMEGLTGIPAGEALEKSLYEVFPQAEGSAGEALLLETLKTAKAGAITESVDALFGPVTKSATGTIRPLSPLPTGFAAPSDERAGSDGSDGAGGAEQSERVESASGRLSLGGAAAVRWDDIPRILEVVTYPSGSGLAVLSRDVTERERAAKALRETEQQLWEAQKMEAVGRLAGGIAHDFNNMLAAIIAYCELALRGVEESPVRDDLEDIQKVAERAATLTRQLLAFSRRQILDPVVTNLNAIVSQMEQMLRRLIREDIELVNVLQANLANVKADRGQIEQVIMNLVVNARDAMANGGKLTIETRNVFLDDAALAHQPGVTPGAYVMMAVSDTGCGIDEETLLRIYEPFFTTKEVGKGTGLGLPTVYGIVKQSGGFIHVDSEVGQGTRFKIYLPQISEAVEDAPISREPAQSLVGHETILVAEDEDTLRKLVARILESRGYRVLQARDGKHALEICEKYPGEIDVLICDVIMPQMDGRQLVQRAIPLKPKMKVIYTSGYTEDAIVHRGILDTGIFFIKKPFNSDTLLEKVRSVIGRKI
jgi:signal transduction histidine kinase/DNA-binding response OmpR family regulator